MTNETPVDIVRRVEELWNANELDRLDQYFAPDFSSDASVPSAPPGLAGAKVVHRGLEQVFPDRRVEIVDLFGAGDRVVVTGRMTGTNKGGIEALNVPANDAKVDFGWISIYEVKGGRIKHHTAITDVYSFFTQLGAIKPPGA